jgi:hypothetical protein
MEFTQPQIIDCATDISTPMTYYLVYLFLRERGSPDPKESGLAGHSVGSMAGFRPGNLNWTWPFSLRH